MNKAHRTHYTDNPDPAIEYVLRGWNPEGGPARHALIVDDVYIRNVPTDIRSGAAIEARRQLDLHLRGRRPVHRPSRPSAHQLEDAHYGAIGRLDIVMVPIDGGMTQSLAT